MGRWRLDSHALNFAIFKTDTLILTYGRILDRVGISKAGAASGSRTAGQMLITPEQVNLLCLALAESSGEAEEPVLGLADSRINL